MVTERRADREEHVTRGRPSCQRELEKVNIPAEISGRAKHFYSIYDKMAKKGREFNEIYDLTAMRVIVQRAGDEGMRDCYGALGLIHSLWKPMPGRFKATSRCRSQRLPVAAHDRDRAAGQAARDPGADARDARDGRARLRRALDRTSAAARRARTTTSGAWMRQLMDWQRTKRIRRVHEELRTDLFDDEVYVFTPNGDVKTLPAGSTPIDFASRCTPTSGTAPSVRR